MSFSRAIMITAN